MFSRAAALLALCIALFASGAARASVTTTALTGRVLSGDAPVAGVTVSVTSTALQQARTTTTNAHGFYWIGALPPGVYEVSFSRTGMSSLIRPALLELGRVARADARLEVNEDEDAVTSTAVPLSVVDDPAITSHFDTDELDRLPLSFDVLSAALLAPGDRGAVYIDDAPLSSSSFIGYEVTEQMTVFRGALPLEFAESDAVALRTRSGGEEFTLAIRDTFFGDGDHVFETASGGSIVSERLWFFASGWGGVEEGLNIKLTAQPGAAHNLVATYFDAGADDLAALRYSGVLGEQLTVEAIGTTEDFLNARASYVVRNHVLTGGASDDALYAYDRWSQGRFAVMGGVRFEEERTMPRAAASFDVRGNGRQTLSASYGEYAFGEELFTAGFATAIGSTGIARIDYMQRNGDDELQLDARYSLFGRLQTGGSYTYAAEEFFEHRGNAWFGAQVPFGEHEVGVTALERYEREEWLTDLAVRYVLPLSRFRFTLGGDVSNAFDDSRYEARAWRIWLRGRI